MKHTLNQAGNTDDVRGSVKSGWPSISKEDLERAIENETRNKNRSTVLALLRASLNKKNNENKKVKPTSKTKRA